MSVLIKGMKMAKNSDCCLFDDGMHCMVYPQSEDMVYDRANGKPEFCPLIELPPHGDLIDRNDLRYSDFDLASIALDKGNPYKNLATDILARIANAPTILEAEEGET